MIFRNTILLLMSIVSLPLGAQGAPPVVRVAATIAPLADWVRMVGGDAVQVACLLPPGASPHTYDPTAKDMRDAMKTQLFVKVGLNLDNWSDKLIAAATPTTPTTSNAKDTTAPVVLDLGAQLQRRKQLPDLACVEPADKPLASLGSVGAGHVHSDACAHGADETGIDPHFWLDPAIAQICVDDIERALTAVCPAQAAVWQAGAQNARHELQLLDEELSATLRPAPRKEFACFHDGFKYLAARYGLVRVAVIEEYPGKSPGDRYLMQVVRDLRKYQITTVFIEPQLSPRVARIIAEEAGAKVATLDPLGATAGRETYLLNMRENARALRNALGN